MITGYNEVAEMLKVLLDAENEAQVCHDEASIGSGVFITDAKVQTDRPKECCALAASKLLDLDLFVRMTSESYSTFWG